MKRTGLSLLMVFIFIITLTTNVFAAENTPPSIVGTMAVTMDLDTGEIIYAKKIDARAYPASTTKLMTALLFAENKKPTDTISYTASAKAQPEYSLNLNMHPMAIGETMSGADTMDALLLFSANDVAYMIGDNVSGDSKAFQDLMNQKVAKLGLKNTHFVSPNGLHDDNHYTTAYDLTVIAREAFKNDWIRETLAKKTSKISTSAGTILILPNRNKLVGEDGCLGGKTGYTAKAGRCLVAFYERNGRKMIGVVMNSAYDSQDSQVFQDMKTIIDWSYAQKQVTVKGGEKGKVVKTATVSYKPLRFFGPTKTIEVPLSTKEDVLTFENDTNSKERKMDVKVDNFNIWSLNSSTQVGTLTLNEREYKKSYGLYTTLTSGDIMKANSFLYTITIVGAVFALIVLVTLIAFIKKLSSTKNRRKRRLY